MVRKGRKPLEFRCRVVFLISLNYDQPDRYATPKNNILQFIHHDSAIHSKEPISPPTYCGKT